MTVTSVQSTNLDFTNSEVGRPSSESDVTASHQFWTVTLNLLRTLLLHVLQSTTQVLAYEYLGQSSVEVAKVGRGGYFS